MVDPVIEERLWCLDMTKIPEKCAHGHALTKTNVYITPRGYWQCRKCKADATRRWRKSKGK